MKLRLLIIIIGIVFLNTIPSLVNAEEFINGIARLKGTLTNGSVVQIKVYAAKLTSQFPYKNAFMWGGDMESETEAIMPKTVVSAINIKMGNENFFMPLSAYCDLGNPYDVRFENIKNGGFKLTIAGHGGEATSYHAVLEFNEENILRKKVFLDTFPDQVWEQTTYSFISKNSKM